VAGAEKALREIYNRRPDELTTPGDAFGGLHALNLMPSAAATAGRKER